jgi:hypothetical protein
VTDPFRPDPVDLANWVPIQRWHAQWPGEWAHLIRQVLGLFELDRAHYKKSEEPRGTGDIAVSLDGTKIMRVGTYQPPPGITPEQQARASRKAIETAALVVLDILAPGWESDVTYDPGMKEYGYRRQVSLNRVRLPDLWWWWWFANTETWYQALNPGGTPREQRTPELVNSWGPSPTGSKAWYQAGKERLREEGRIQALQA